jgi:hypothetical protein
MKEHKKQSIKNSPPTHPSSSRGEGKGGSEKDIALLHPIRSPLSRQGWRGNEKGLAIVMVLILAAIALAIMAGLIYMITSSTQISGMQKRYETAREAAKGGADVTYQLIGLRGDTSKTSTLLSELSAISPAITTSSSCTGTNIEGISFSGLAAKFNTPTTSWSLACGGDSMSIIPPPPSGPDNTTYDMRFDLGTSPYPTYRVYAKIVDTVEGNSGSDEGLLGQGVVASGSGEVTVVSIPYLYTIEIDSEGLSNPSERAKLSILYQY